MDTTAAAIIRSAFAGAARSLVELAGAVPPDAWDRPALGVWSVRDLIGHTGRALSTVETYLATPATGPVVEGPVEYFLTVRGSGSASEAVAVAVAQRGRDAGAALGDDPPARVAELARRVTELVAGTADDAPLATAAGTMTLVSYLPTRTFELAVHGLDLARAIGVPPPDDLTPAVVASLSLAADLAGRLDTGPDILLLLTGRTGLPDGLQVL